MNTNRALSYEEFHKLATAPFPTFNIISPKPHAGNAPSVSFDVLHNARIDIDDDFEFNSSLPKKQ